MFSIREEVFDEVVCLSSDAIVVQHVRIRTVIWEEVYWYWCLFTEDRLKLVIEGVGFFFGGCSDFSILVET